MKKLTFSLISIISILLITISFVGSATADSYNYSIIDLGTLGGNYSMAWDINERGQIVGVSTNHAGSPQHAFIWENGTMYDLGTSATHSSEALGINNLRQVVGYSGDMPASTYAYIWENGTFSPILGGETWKSMAVNNDSEVVGDFWSGTGSHAFFWSQGNLTDLGTLGGRDSYANDINNDGQVVGGADIASGERHPFLWKNGTMIDLGTLGMHHGYATAINSEGQIVGRVSDISGTTAYLFLWENGVMTILGGGDISPWDINNPGQIVGYYFLDGVETAFTSYKGQLYDLNSFLNPNSGWYLMDATAINNRGQIVGKGIINGEEHAFLMTRVAEPATILLLALGLVGIAVNRREIQK